MRPGETTLRRLLAPIQGPLDHPETTELIIQKPGEVGIEQRGKWQWINVPEFDFKRLDAISLLAGRLLSKDFDAAHPIVETTLPGRHRYTAIRPPITPEGTISITIRKPKDSVSPPKEQDFCNVSDNARHLVERHDPADEELLRLYHAKEWTAFFELAVRSRKTIAATGQQFSGKTTFLRKIMQAMPPEDRVVTVEDTDEFLDLPVGPDMRPMRNRVSMIYGAADVTAEKAILTTLRMRADRVAIQELRGAEAYAFLRIHAAGQRGSFATWHAHPHDPFTPLALMVRSHPNGREIPSEDLPVMLREAVDIVAYCYRNPVTDEFATPASVYFRLADAQPSPG